MASHVPLNVLNRQHWERPRDSERLGCVNCSDRQVCGGIRPDAPIFSCRDYCCGQPDSCSRVCDRRPESFIDRCREVNGWGLENIPARAPLSGQPMPVIIPEIYHSSRRTESLRTQAVAVPLRAVVRADLTGCRFSSKSDLLSNLKVTPRASIIIDCVGRDALIENFWAYRRQSNLIKAMARLSPAWVITPNYSVLTDVPRWDNLHAIKRIALVWSELVAEGIPTAITLNARTDQDWLRWTDFVVSRREVEAVAVEFGTGAKYADRRRVLLDKLHSLGEKTGGRLRLFMRGGRGFQAELSTAFQATHVIDTSVFMKTVYRQRIISTGVRVSTVKSPTSNEESIEDLLQHNVSASTLKK